MLSNAIFASKYSEKNWANYVILTYKTPCKIQPSIFQVPKSLKDTKPVAYTPHNLGLGPFHHCHPELHEKMLTKKREALSYYKVDFQKIIDFVKRRPQHFEEIIQSCYGGYLDLDRETLMLIVIVDAIYLLHFLYTQLGPEKEKKQQLLPLIPDTLMLENQIPITLIREVLQHEKLEEDFTKETDLFDAFYNFCSKLSPLKLATDGTSREFRDFMKKTTDNSPPNHLLHFTHQLVVGKMLDEFKDVQFEDSSHRHNHPIAGQIKYGARKTKIFFEQIIGEINSATAKAKEKGLRIPEWLGKPLENIQKAFVNSSDKKPSVLEKVHSVSEIRELTKINFASLPIGFGFGNINFQNNVISLPVMSLDSNSEVVLRNLLAFEAAYEDNVSGPSSEVKDHIGLMCAITRSKEDLKLLKDAGIIVTEIEDDAVLKLFKGMKKSMEKLSQKSMFVDIYSKITRYDYNSAPVVKACNWIKKWALAFSNIVKPLFPVLVLLLLFLQWFCDIYDCRRRPSLGPVKEAAAEQHLPLPDHSSVNLDPQALFLTPRKFPRYSS